jgi:rod shape-determining protein MreB
VHLIEESIAAAIGAGVPIAEPIGRMVVDVGGGTSEVAVISLGQIVVSRSVRVGGYDLDDAIAAHIRNEHRDGDRLAERRGDQARRRLGARRSTRSSSTIRGRDLLSGLPRELELGSEEVRGAIDSPLADIMASVHATLEETPPELAGDIVRHGILLAGGGALLRGFAERVQPRPRMRADSPTRR